MMLCRNRLKQTLTAVLLLGPVLFSGIAYSQDSTKAGNTTESKIRNIDITIKKLEAAKLVATNKPAELASNIANARDSAKLICTKGF